VLGLMSRLAVEQGLNLYLVGGAVRDLTYGQQVVRDLDFAVEGSPQKILRSLPGAEDGKPRRSGQGAGADLAFTAEYQVYDDLLNAAELRFSNGVRAELGMCREEFYPRPGQRPEVRPATIFEDLKRRDLAINAMAVSLHPNSRGLLLDPTNGAGDIERRELRALSSHSFTDDPSRIYRLLRLGLRLDFKPDERTQRWLVAALDSHAWEHLDSNQQARELAAILYEDHPERVFKLLADREILAGLDKKLASVHIPYDRLARIHSVLQNVSGADPLLLNFHCLAEKLGSEATGRLAKRIIGDSKAIKLMLSFDRDAGKLERLLSSSKAEIPSHVYALLSPQPQPLLLFLLAHSSRIKVQNRIKNYLFKFPLIRASLPRTELQSLGIKPGPEFDRILEQIFALQLDGKIKSHQQLMKELRALAGIKEPPPPPIHPPKKTKETAPASQPAKKGKEAATATPPHPPKKGKEAAKTLQPAGSAKPAAPVATKPAKPAGQQPKPVPKQAKKAHKP